MKKVMLGLVMVVMLMSLVGCGETTSNEEKNSIVESEVETEVKVDMNGNVITETNSTEVENDIKVVYGILSFPENIDEAKVVGATVNVYNSDGSDAWGKSVPFEDNFLGKNGATVKVTYKIENYVKIIISVEFVEE